MNLSRGSLPLALMLSISIGLSSMAGCAGCGGGGTDDDDPIDPARNPVLEFVDPGDASQFLLHDETVSLRVRYVYSDDRSPIGGATLAYDIEGDAEGARLDARSADTGGDGIASVRLTSGRNANFQVRVTPPEGPAIAFAVTVAEHEVGAIVVRMSYDGEQDFTTFRPLLFESRRCEPLDPESLPSAERSGPTASSIAERPRFDNVDPGNDYTVVVVAEVSGVIEGWGCAESVVVTARQETTVDIPIEDIDRPLVWAGVYELESYLDFAGTLPPSVSSGVAIFDELTDDDDIECDDATEDYGQDPGAFLLDFVMRWTCAWECLPGEDRYEDCSEVNHPTGDLRLFCLENFQTWDHCEPRFIPGGCGAWELGAAEAAMEFINDQIDALVPDFITNIVYMAGDLSRAINHAHVFSLLTVDEMEELGAPFSHVLTEMQVRLRDWDDVWHDFRFDLEEVGFSSLTAHETLGVDGTTMTIAEHRFNLDYGELVRYIYIHGLLRSVLGYDDTAAMLADWIDCGDVADWLVSAVGILSRDTYFDACTGGLEAAGSAIENALGASVSGDGHLTLAGTVEAGTVDEDNLVQTLVDGEWTGSWGEGTDSGPVTGEFTGERQ